MNDNVAYSPSVAYSPLKDDLYLPCKNAQFFASGPPRSEAALCVEMARLAYCRADDFSFNQARIKSELARVNFDVAGFFESRRNQGRGTHCLLAMRQDRELAVAAFRGTDKDDPTDLADDLDALPVAWDGSGQVHRGFAGALAQVRGEVEQALQSIPCRVLLTGHSLGAALATLLASVKAPDALYTFGSPLVGDSDFLATLNAVKNYRYVDCCDIVTRVPPEVFGYRHLGKPYYIALDRSIRVDPGDDFIRKDRMEAFLEYPVKYHAWHKAHVGVRELADHAPVNYVSAVTAAEPPA